MTKERIEKIRDSKERARQRQSDNYQSTGEMKYYSAMNRYEDLVEICNQALTTAEDHDKCVRMSSQFMILAGKAAELKHKGDYRDADKVKDFLHELVGAAERFGFLNPYS